MFSWRLITLSSADAGQAIHSAVGLLLALLKKAVARYSNANERSTRFCKKTRELRVFKFSSGAVRLKGLKREVTVSRFLRESLGERPELVRVLEWNFATHPYFLESEYGGPNFAEWAESQGGLARIPLRVRLDLLADVARAVASAHAAGVLHKDLKPPISW